MKHTFLLAALLVWLCGALSAQNYSLDNKLRSLFDPLDKSTIRSGILLDQAAVFTNPLKYDGHVLNDTNCMSSSQFGRLFGQFRAAAVGNTVLPPPSVYMDILKKNPKSHGDTIPLALMAMQYDRIRTDAVQQGLLGWNDANQKLYDVPTRTASPFQLDTLFGFSAMLQDAKGKDVVFKLPANWIFSNLSWEFRNLEMDFDDGKGWTALESNMAYPVHYSTPGQKTIRLRVLKNGQYWQAHSWVNVPEGSAQERYSNSPDEIVHIPGCNMSIFYDCEDHKLRKPLIVVEGFGGEQVNYTKLLSLLSFTFPDGSGTLNDWFDENGYDLIC